MSEAVLMSEAAPMSQAAPATSAVPAAQSRIMWVIAHPSEAMGKAITSGPPRCISAGNPRFPAKDSLEFEYILGKLF